MVSGNLNLCYNLLLNTLCELIIENYMNFPKMVLSLEDPWPAIVSYYTVQMFKCRGPDHQLAEPTYRPNLMKAEAYTGETEAYCGFLIKIILPNLPLDLSHNVPSPNIVT